jgi:hypothetical protein
VVVEVFAWRDGEDEALVADGGGGCEMVVLRMGGDDGFDVLFGGDSGEEGNALGLEVGFVLL